MSPNTDIHTAFQAWHSKKFGWINVQRNPRDTSKYSESGVQVRWMIWQAATEAAKATGTAGELPPLPEAIAGGPLDGLYTADQMRDYGRSCEKGALARGAAAMAKDFAAREPMSRDHADCQSCVDGKCTTGDYCVTLGLDDDPLYWKQRALKAEAARQPAPAVSSDLRNAAQLIMDLYDDMRMGKQAIPAFDALRAALAATAAPVLSDEEKHQIEGCLHDGAVMGSISEEALNAMRLILANGKSFEHKATYEGVECSRYVIEWENGSMPAGTKLYAITTSQKAQI